MLDTFPVSLAIGTILGFLSGLGIGGGSLLILWLTLVLHTDAPVARCLNLMFFIPSALVASIFHILRKNIPWKDLLPGIVAGCAGAALCCLLLSDFNMVYLNKLWGVLLICIGIRELLPRKKSA